MHIYIPSLGRAGQVYAGPLGDMDPSTPVTYVVPPDEHEHYSQVVAPWENANVVACPEQGIAKTRLWIGQHARESGYGEFAMLDDDIRFLVRKSADNWQLRPTEPHEVTELLTMVESFLVRGWGHVGVSAREGNNRIGVGDKGTLYGENTRTIRFLAYQTQAFLNCEHGRVEVMEDFDVNLQLLRRGLPNACLYYWAQGQKMTNAPGGCSTYRSHEVHERSAKKLAELHPGLVALRQKQNKTDAEGFGTRTEVTIQWKRAYGHG